MQDLKTLLERNIDLERQKLYKEQQYQAYHHQEVHAKFKSEIEGIRNLFDEQNPLYYNFLLRAEVVDEQDYKIKLVTVKEFRIQPEKQPEYYYRGHLVKPANSEPKIERIVVTEMYAQWLVNEGRWAAHAQESTGGQQLAGSRNDLLKYFLNVTVKDIAKKLEEEANMAAAAQ